MTLSLCKQISTPEESSLSTISSLVRSFHRWFHFYCGVGTQARSVENIKDGSNDMKGYYFTKLVTEQRRLGGT